MKKKNNLAFWFIQSYTKFNPIYRWQFEFFVCHVFFSIIVCRDDVTKETRGIWYKKCVKKSKFNIFLDVRILRSLLERHFLNFPDIRKTFNSTILSDFINVRRTVSSKTMTNVPTLNYIINHLFPCSKLLVTSM